ncbi:MAG: hypothetical protein GC159_15160 [Phycisphaera sp.]|nr:hypothetical protein [Phycisphaera sp.]
MSKCDMRIEFDRGDRTYRGGDTITGQVVVRANADVECRKLVISRYWQTHGRGNVDTGDADELIVFSGVWSAGQTEKYRFSFECPASPSTYRGNYLNIDHYIKAQADIPWAFDPKVSEEFIVLTGGTGGAVEAETLSSAHAMTSGMKAAGVGCGVIGGIIAIAIGLAIPFPVGFVAIPVGLFLIGASLRKTVAAKRLGDVGLRVTPQVCGPGDTIAIDVRVEPKKPLKLNGATAKIICRERCVSGSGSNRTTHRHIVHEQTATLTKATTLSAGRAVVMPAKLLIPRNAPYSFAASNNTLEWELEIHIDIPWWPDWKEQRVIAIKPHELLDRAAAQIDAASQPIDVEESAEPQEMRHPPRLPHAAPPPKPVGPPPLPTAIPDIQAAPLPVGPPAPSTPSAPPAKPQPQPEPPVVEDTPTPDVERRFDAFDRPTGAIDARPTPVDEPAAPTPPAEPAAAAASDDAATGAADTGATTNSAAGMAAVVERIRAASRFGPERQQLIDTIVGKRYSLDVEVTRTGWTFGAEEPYRDGRTVTGNLAGTRLSVGLRFPKDRNDEIDKLRNGDKLTATGVVHEWSMLYDHPELDAE